MLHSQVISETYYNRPNQRVQAQKVTNIHDKIRSHFFNTSKKTSAKIDLVDDDEGFGLDIPKKKRE
jgi:hypothetical protein